MHEVVKRLTCFEYVVDSVVVRLSTNWLYEIKPEQVSENNKRQVDKPWMIASLFNN